MAIVVKNEFAKYIEDIIPHSNRLLETRIRAKTTTSVLFAYAPQAHRPTLDKEDFYSLCTAKSS